MPVSPSFDDIFAVMTAASLGDAKARVVVPASPPADDAPTTFALTLNRLLDDLERKTSEGRRELAEHRRLAKRLQVLADSSREFSDATGALDRLLEIVARRLGETLGDMCAVRLVAQGGAWLESEGAVYHADPELHAAVRAVILSGRQRLGEGISGRVAATGEPFIASRVATSDFAAATDAAYRPFLERIGVGSSMTLPLLYRGVVVGVVNLIRHSPDDPYGPSDLHFAQSIADHAGLAIGNTRSYAAERAARARFTRLFESGIIGVVVYDLEKGRVLEINDTLLHVLGYSRDELVSGRVAWTDLTPPEWAAVDADATEQLASTGIGELREKEFFHKGGGRVPVLLGTAMLDGDARQCITFVLDVTERKEAHAAIERMGRELATEAKAFALAAIVESSDDAIIGKTLDGVITTWNDGARRLFGYSADEIVGKSIFLLVPPERAHEEPVILDAAASGAVKRFDTVRRRKDGRAVDVSVTVSPVRDAAGKVVSISKVARDITDWKAAEASLAKAKDAAEAANRELEAFSYSVAHDLRAPLRGMNGFAQLLLNTYEDKLDADGRDWLNEILLNAKKMGELIDSLLSLARMTRSDLKLTDVDLSAIARETAAELTASAPDRHVDVEVQDRLHAHADPRLVRVLLENLMGNAWKFTGKAASPRIELGATRANGAPAFFVRDNGAGFDMAFAAKLFAPFQRLHTVDEFPGTGIGLATVQRIVHRHGGRIWAEGAVGGGATFHFTLSAQTQRPAS
jgi:PAS domain S-box-containing protein